MSRLPEPPLVRGWPLVGNLLALRGNPIPFFLTCYQRVGPVFRVAVLDKRFLVLAGQEANLFLAQSGDRHLHNRQVFGELVAELGGEQVIIAQDGSAHRHARRQLQPAFTREAVARYLPQMAAVTRETVQAWQVGQRLDVVDGMRRLITAQTGLAMAGHAPGAAFEDISTFFVTLISATLAKRQPRSALQATPYRKAKVRVEAMMRDLLAQRRGMAVPTDERNFLDLLLGVTDEEGEPLSDGDQLATSHLPYFGGLDTTASSCAFLLYALLAHPALLEEVIAEADVALARGPLDHEALKAMPTLHGAVLETLRLYPVAPAARRYVAEPFEFAGYPIAAGQQLLFATSLTHHLPELFPNPDTFDATRYHAPRNEHRQPGAFLPFGAGPHTCLGAGLAEAQLMVTAATLLHHARLELDPPRYRLKTSVSPIPRPVGLQARVVALR